MSSPRKANDDIAVFFDVNLHLPSRTIYCGNLFNENLEATDHTIAEYFLKAMHLLNLGENPSEIKVILNHWGGDEYHNLAIYDAIATSKAHITCFVYGAAFSMGSWILQAADYRVLSPHATLLLHYGSWDLTTEDASEERVASTHNEGQRLRRLMERVYLSRIQNKVPKFTEEDIKKLLRAESYIPALQAVELGLADEVLDAQES